MVFSLKKYSLPVAGTYMDCVAFGKGEKPLVILPGLGVQGVKAAAPGLAFMYRDFGKDFRVYVFDKPRDIDEGCTIGELAAFTAAAMAELHIRKAAVLGVSMGGMMALELAIEHPELVDRLVPALTAARPNPSIAESIGIWTAQVGRGAYPEFFRDMFARMYSPAYLRRYRFMLPLLRLVPIREPERFLRLAAACLTVDCYDRLPLIACPTLVIGAEKDRVVSAQASRDIADALGCKCHMYPGLGHAAYEEADDFNRIVLDFFKA